MGIVFIDIPVTPFITVGNEVAKVMFLHVSVILFTWGWYPCMHCRWYPSMNCNMGCAIPACLAGGVPSLGGSAGGMPAPGGCLLWGVPHPLQKQTATVTDGTHPTGMHS